MIVALRIALGFGLIALLVWTGLLDVRLLGGALRRPYELAGAALLLFATLPVAAVRWQALLYAQGIRLEPGATLRVVLASGFFGTFLPGMLGGDLLRSGYIIRAARGRASTGLLSIVMDRALGLAGLLLVSALLALAHPAQVPRAIAVAIAGAVATLAMAALVLPRIVQALGRRAAHPHGPRAALARAMRELHAAFDIYRGAGGGLVTGVFLSGMIATLDIAALLLMMRALDIGALTGMQQALACTLALVANSVPLTPGGLGVGEAAFANAALALEPVRSGAPYATAFLAYRCVMVISTLPGAFVGLRAPRRAQK